VLFERHPKQIVLEQSRQRRPIRPRFERCHAARRPVVPLMRSRGLEHPPTVMAGTPQNDVLRDFQQPSPFGPSYPPRSSPEAIPSRSGAARRLRDSRGFPCIRDENVTVERPHARWIHRPVRSATPLQGLPFFVPSRPCTTIASVAPISGTSRNQHPQPPTPLTRPARRVREISDSIRNV
jgi:hypothetical protein